MVIRVCALSVAVLARLQNAADPSEVPAGPPLKLGAVGGLAAAAIAAGSGNNVVRGVAGVGAMALGAWVGATSVAERARL